MRKRAAVGAGVRREMRELMGLSYYTANVYDSNTIYNFNSMLPYQYMLIHNIISRPLNGYIPSSKRSSQKTFVFVWGCTILRGSLQHLS